jgi:hypothetical protein
MTDDKDFYPRFIIRAVFLLAFALVAYWLSCQFPHWVAFWTRMGSH